MTLATVLDGTATFDIEVSVTPNGLALDAAQLEVVSGWSLKPEGLCRGDVCIPVRDRTALVTDRGLDVDEFSRLTGRVAAFDAERGVIALADSAERRSASLASLEAPDFTLPDLAGNPVSLHDFDRRKRLLLAWSSW